jgi:hypothetical protein
MNTLASALKPAVPLLDVLLRIRQDMLSREAGPYLYIGMPDAQWVRCFVSGYERCLHFLSVEEGPDALFRDWLRDVRGALPGQGWPHAYLEMFGGDHRRAVLHYLDFVAEFRALSLQTLSAMDWPFAEEPHPASRLPSWVPTRPPTSTLDMLLEIRREIGDTPGRLGMFIGYISVSRMAGLIDGHRLCLTLAGSRDEEYFHFERWLHEHKAVPSGQSWPPFFLQSCGSDDEQAIRQFLAVVAEFRGLES